MSIKAESLLEQLNATMSSNDGRPDIEEMRPKLRYGIYTRKSSDESSDKQQKSIADQRVEIQKYIIERFDIDITQAKLFKDEESAKVANIRPGFNRMIEMLRAGELDGIIAWHPDRLSRNMLEAGIIIDLADNGIIMDMLFVGHQFENNSTGKMMLGILFAISKQYSEHLSESVIRAFDETTKKGEVKSSFVHGYRRLPDDRLEPDGENFTLIKEAFKMRLAGSTVKQIAEYLNDNCYRYYNRKTDEHKISEMNTDKVSRILRNTIYAGFYKYGNRKYVDLKELYNFIPVVSEDEYSKIAELDKSGKTKFISRGTVISDITNRVVFLRNKVTCGHCNSFMGFTTGKSRDGSQYGYFRCNNTKCSFKSLSNINPKEQRHSISAKTVRRELTDRLLNSIPKPEGYAKYREDFAERLERLSEEAKKKKIKLTNRRTVVRKDRRSTLNTIDKLTGREDADDSLIGYYIDNVKAYDEKLSDIKLNLEQLDKQLKYLGTDIYDTEEKFFEHLQKIKNYLCKTNKLDEIDKILSTFFSNTIILDKAISVIQLNSDWENVISLVWLGR